MKAFQLIYKRLLCCTVQSSSCLSPLQPDAPQHGWHKLTSTTTTPLDFQKIGLKIEMMRITSMVINGGLVFGNLNVKTHKCGFIGPEGANYINGPPLYRALN